MKDLEGVRIHVDREPLSLLRGDAVGQTVCVNLPIPVSSLPSPIQRWVLFSLLLNLS